MRRSLLLRLLAVSVVVAVCAIAATTWLVMSATTTAIRQQQGRSLADDARIYRELVRHAARHRDWDAVDPTVRALARRTGRAIVLTTPSRAPLAATGPIEPLPRRPLATVDALDVDPALEPDAGADRIAPAATGPFRRHAPGAVTAPVPAAAPVREVMPLDVRAAVGQRRALGRLDALTRRCLRDRRHDVDPGVSLDAVGLPHSAAAASDRTVASCYRRARRQQLRPHVAPAALLFVAGADGATATSLDLSGPHRRRVIVAALVILVLTVTVTGLAARRVVRPLSAITRAAERMTAGDLAARAEVRGDDEIGRLAGAFNAMAARRERLEDQRTAMVSDVAHELRTPVSNIRGWLEAAEDGLAEPDAAFVGSLLEEATVLSHLIGDLQDLSAAEAGELRLHPEPLDVEELLRQVAAAHRPAAEQAGVTLALETASALALHADPVRMRQSVGNLVGNAIRHSPPGATVTLRARGAPGAVEIAVADAGDGIAPEHLDHVFDRFWRAEKSRSRRAGGRGLGLAIVRRLVEAHGGTVTVQSRPGAGATFTIRLPSR